MTTILTDAEIKEKREKAADYGGKRTGKVYFKNREEQEKACFWLDVVLCYHATGFQDDKGFDMKSR